jgi:hypothetical protein
MAQANTLEDGEGVTFPHKDALVITTIISNHKVHQVLVDDGSVVNILSIEACPKLESLI